MSQPVTKGKKIRWYRTPIDSAELKILSQRSDLQGCVQTLSYLGLCALTTAAALYGAGRWPMAIVILIVLAHGTVWSFMINGVHELGHGTVFRTRWLNEFFVRVLSFLGWINFHSFNSSHMRHHAYTLHPPDDLEVVLPTKLMIRHFLSYGFINFPSVRDTIKNTVRIARGKFEGDWELILFPASDPEKRRPPVNWARTLLIGHGLILGLSIYFHLWLVPVLITLASFYGGWLHFLCNNTQHIGLQDNVPDFRLCCRTFLLNPLVGLLYWRMNYHTEHHMYPTVPCYNLHRLHLAVRHDLPPCPRGLIATWREIIGILKIQFSDPAYQHKAPVPSPAAVSVEQTPTPS